MRRAIAETDRRRQVQEAYNAEHGITPASIIKNIDDVLSSVYERDYVTVPTVADEREQYKTQAELDAAVGALEKEMRAAAANLEFERAASLRDRLKALRNPDLVDQAGARALMAERVKRAVLEVQEYLLLVGQVARGARHPADLSRATSSSSSTPSASDR